jgi:hypothetical protein
MQCACAILSSVVRPAVQYLSTLSHKRHDFRKFTEYELCVLIFCTTLSETFNILRRIQRSVNITVQCISVCSLYSVYRSAPCTVYIGLLPVQCISVCCMYSVYRSAACTVYIGLLHVQCISVCSLYSVYRSAACTVYIGLLHVQCISVCSLYSVYRSAPCTVYIGLLHVQCISVIVGRL